MTLWAKRLMAILLVATGIFHLAVAYADHAPQIVNIQTALTVFGLVYFFLGIFIWAGGRTAVLIGMLMAGVGIGLGGQDYLRHGGPASLVVMFAIDAAVILFGGVWLVKNKTANA